MSGQNINLMTLGGLALAVGILVDEATVSIENIHTHLARGVPKARAVVDASATLERMSAGVFTQGWTADEVATLTALLGRLAGRYPGATPRAQRST